MRIPRTRNGIMWPIALALCLGLASPSVAAAQGDQRGGVSPSEFITLGTKGGPEPEGARSQPANALVVGRDVYLVDVGDGTAQQLAKAGISLSRLRGVFISHLHFDHTGGLAAILGLRFQMGTTGPLAIYGPPGTKELVSGLIASMQPEARTGIGIPGEAYRDPAASASVVEILDGASLSLDAFTVMARGNTHYGVVATTDPVKRSQSLSFRFNLPDRSIVYTGDTGPSLAVQELAQGADLLVSEIIDIDATEGHIIALHLPGGEERTRQVIAHLRTHHLTPADVGILARNAKVKSVVLTHLSGFPPPGTGALKYLSEIGLEYHGPVAIAEDLDRF